MKNPYIFFTVLALVFIGGFLLGNSAWAKGIIRGKSVTGNGNGNGNGNNVPAEGSECTLADGTKGSIVNGVCTGGRPPVDTSSERTSNTNINTQKTGAGATIPNLILIPYNADCRARITAQSPYKYGGCSFVFKQNIKQNGVAYCQLEKVSCP